MTKDKKKTADEEEEKASETVEEKISKLEEQGISKEIIELLKQEDLPEWEI